MTFDFIFERSEGAQVNRLTIKDMKEQISNIGKSMAKLELLFKMLEYSFMGQIRSQQFSGDGVNFMEVELNMQEIILAIGKFITHLFVIKV